MRGLPAGSPAIAAGPLSPPFMRLGREVSRKPPLGRTAMPWHGQHFSTMSGRTLFSKNSASARDGSVALATGHASAASRITGPTIVTPGMARSCRVGLLRQDHEEDRPRRN